MSSNSQYRADIDGLRAIAVVAVLLFHLVVPGFSGGFIGVDVFFVISGYLITGLIVADLSKSKFSLKIFYLRRIRRLAPALIVVLVPTTVAAFLLLKPVDLKAFAASLGFQFLPLQNFYFLSVGDYFTAAERKPLLHTWTLAVEEQFYVLWPLLLLFLRKYSISKRVIGIVVLMVASFALNLGMMGISPKASFFLLPARAWELGLGGVIAIWRSTWLSSSPRWLMRTGTSTALAVTGLVAVLVPVFIYGAQTPFPGWAALAPVVGAGALIVAGAAGPNAISRALSIAPMVYIGKISYPLYLWHWPLISFAYLLGAELGTWRLTTALILSSWGLADLTVRWFEAPVRERRWLAESRSLVATAALAAATLTGAAVHLWLSNGAAYRYPEVSQKYLLSALEARSERCGLIFRVLNPKSHVCSIVEVEKPTRRVLLWGNSHADMWSAMMKGLAQTSDASFYLNARNCRAVTDSAFCGRHVQAAVLKFVADNGITDVVLASTWHGAYGRPDAQFEGEFVEVVQQVADAGGKVWMVVDVPASKTFDPEEAFAAAPVNPVPGRLEMSSYAPVLEKQLALFQKVANMVPDGMAEIIDPSSAYCVAEQCMGGDENGPWYRDANHLNDAGAVHAAGHFRPVFGVQSAEL